MTKITNAVKLQKHTGLSDEVRARLEYYAAELRRWQKKINLTGPSALANLWERHFLESIELFQYIPTNTKTLLDLGSGNGFPGLVLALMGGDFTTHLIDSSTKKTSFLAYVSRETGAKAHIHNSRIQDVTPFPADIITARALAPLAELLQLAQPFMQKNTELLLIKSRNYQQELAIAQKIWHIEIQELPWKWGNLDSSILNIKDFKRV